ncbi:uncharacterized protein LOC129950783 [Eupeodes corollae]|uniref:uncharacterized protein LOC129950783 n=1 Tax=Eupeodes corollae TaxID=290404 RepID=UPI00249184CD|nr:uncharacterized protein LOC129950783 [Eupeodes corollae]
MSFLKAILLLVLFKTLFGLNSGFNELIVRVYRDSDSATLAFLCLDDEFLSGFMKQHGTKPVLIFNSPIKGKSNEIVKRNTILVVKQGKPRVSSILIPQIIAKLEVRKFVIVLATNFKSLQKYFKYFCKHKFTRIFGYTNNTSFVYLNYRDNPIQQISMRKDHALPNALTNLNGFRIRTTFQTDVPRTFWYHNVNGQPKVGGYFGQIFTNFVEKHNATFEEVILENSTNRNYLAVLEACMNGDLDISSNVFSPIPGCDHSSFLKLNAFGIMVPMKKNVNSYHYFIKPFTPLLWMAILMTFLYISAMDFLKDFYSGNQADVWKSLSETFLRLLNLPSRLPTASYRFHTQVLIFAFVLGNFYLNYFTSFLTVFVKVKQFETFDDLLENNISVMVPLDAVDFFYLEHPKVQGNNLYKKIIITTDYETFIENLNSMKASNKAYIISHDRFEFLIKVQAIFEEPMFRMIEFFKEYFQTFLLSPHSPFKEILSLFIVRTFETGLTMKWEGDTVSQALRAGFDWDGRRNGAEILHTPLTMIHLQFAWICLAFGWILAAIVLLCEITVNSDWKIFRI